MYLKLFLIFAVSVLALLLLFGVAVGVDEEGERSEKGGDLERAQNRQGIS